MTEPIPQQYNPQELLHPEQFSPPKKSTLKKFTIILVFISVAALFLFIFAMALEKMNYKKDLQTNIKKKVKIIQDSQTLLTHAHSDFNLTEFCQKNTNTADCSVLDLPLVKIMYIDNTFTKVIEILIQYHNKSAVIPTPVPTKTLDPRCPKTAYVNCLPGPDNVYRPECDESFLNWAKKNCPGFQGAVN